MEGISHKEPDSIWPLRDLACSFSNFVHLLFAAFPSFIFSHFLCSFSSFFCHKGFFCVFWLGLHVSTGSSSSIPPGLTFRGFISKTPASTTLVSPHRSSRSYSSRPSAVNNCNTSP